MFMGGGGADPQKIFTPRADVSIDYKSRPLPPVQNPEYASIAIYLAPSTFLNFLNFQFFENFYNFFFFSFFLPKFKKLNISVIYNAIIQIFSVNLPLVFIYKFYQNLNLATRRTSRTTKTLCLYSMFF